VIRFDCPEFTCLCPKTGQPDFATIRVEYVPDALCVELKSWKLYLWSYRDEGAFHEAVTNRILDDLVAAVSPAPRARRGRVQRARRHHDDDRRRVQEVESRRAHQRS
jgi:7-cyano-7-deazaguanine reductase